MPIFITMIKAILQFLHRHSQGKKVLLLLGAANAVYCYMLWVSIPRLLEYSGGMKILDMLPAGYDLQYIMALFEALGPEGRAYYLKHQLPVDMLYPLLFALAYALLSTWLLKKVHKFHEPYFYLSFLPLIAGAADYLENIGIAAMLQAYPDISEILAKISMLFSLLKSTTTSLFFVVLLIYFAHWGLLSIRKARTKS